MIDLVNKLIYGIFTVFVLLSSLRDRSDRILALLISWIFLTTMLLTGLPWIPRVPSEDNALSIFLYWASDLIMFSWFFGHYIAWRSYRGIRRRGILILLGVASIPLFFLTAWFYRLEQFDGSGIFLGLLEKSLRWSTLHAVIILCCVGALYHLVRFVIGSSVRTAHLVLMLSTFLSFVQVAFTMKIGIIQNYNLYCYGLLVYLLAGTGIYGYRVFHQRFLRPSRDSRGGGDLPRMEAGPPA